MMPVRGMWWIVTHSHFTFANIFIIHDRQSKKRRVAFSNNSACFVSKIAFLLNVIDVVYDWFRREAFRARRGSENVFSDKCLMQIEYFVTIYFPLTSVGWGVIDVWEWMSLFERESWAFGEELGNNWFVLTFCLYCNQILIDHYLKIIFKLLSKFCYLNIELKSKFWCI